MNDPTIYAIWADGEGVGHIRRVSGDRPVPPLVGWPDGRRGEPMVAASTAPDLLRNARECPSRSPIPEAEREGCGCSHRCDAGRSTRPNGGVTVLDCWSCDLAPRRSWPVPTPPSP